jgi:hypothetical protein
MIAAQNQGEISFDVFVDHVEPVVATSRWQHLMANSTRIQVTAVARQMTVILAITRGASMYHASTILMQQLKNYVCTVNII